MDENLNRKVNAVIVGAYMQRRGLIPYFIRDKTGKTNIVLISVN